MYGPGWPRSMDRRETGGQRDQEVDLGDEAVARVVDRRVAGAQPEAAGHVGCDLDDRAAPRRRSRGLLQGGQSRTPLGAERDEHCSDALARSGCTDDGGERSQRFTADRERAERRIRSVGHPCEQGRIEGQRHRGDVEEGNERRNDHDPGCRCAPPGGAGQPCAQLPILETVGARTLDPLPAVSGPRFAPPAAPGVRGAGVWLRLAHQRAGIPDPRDPTTGLASRWSTGTAKIDRRWCAAGDTSRAGSRPAASRVDPLEAGKGTGCGPRCGLAGVQWTGLPPATRRRSRGRGCPRGMWSSES